LTNQQYGEQQRHPAVLHSDALVNRMAHSIGYYTARTYLRIQGITHTAREEADRPDQQKTQQTEPSEQATAQAEEPNQPATRKAEEMVDYLTQRLSSLTTTVKFNFQRTAARAREDAEDMWAEAQNIRHHRNEPLPQ
jgi:hypothetical protein